MKSENYYLTSAILALRPGSQFAMVEDNYSTIEWHVLDGSAPTKAAINSEIEKIKAAELIEADNKAAAVASAVAKLSALGLTAEEIAALKS